MRVFANDFDLNCFMYEYMERNQTHAWFLDPWLFTTRCRETPKCLNLVDVFFSTIKFYMMENPYKCIPNGKVASYSTSYIISKCLRQRKPIILIGHNHGVLLKIYIYSLKTHDQGTLTKHRQTLFLSLAKSSFLQISCFKRYSKFHS